MISRRRIVFALGASALAAPFAAFAQQQGNVWRVGCLAQGTLDTGNFRKYFTQGMRELGYVVGKNLIIDWSAAEGDSGRLPALAAGLVRLKPDVIVVQGTPAARAAQMATTTIPIVMATMGDPIGSGLVKSLARPGGNSTGMSIMVAELGTQAPRAAAPCGAQGDAHRGAGLSWKPRQRCGAEEHPGGGAEARRKHPGLRGAHARGDCRRLCRHRGQKGGGARRAPGIAFLPAQGADRGACGQAPPANHRGKHRKRGGRILDELRPGLKSEHRHD